MKSDVQQIVVESISDPTWQEKAFDSVQSSVGDHGVTGLVVMALAGAGFLAYKKFKKKK